LVEDDRQLRPAGELTAADRETSWWWSPWFWLSLTFALAICRAPGLLIEPRLFAEEASIYLAYSRHHSFLATLFLVPTAGGPAGYMMLATNLVMALGQALPLEYLPRLTSLAALGIQLLPTIAVLFGRSACWPSVQGRVGAAMVFALSPALAPETWLTTLHAPIYLALTATVILLAEEPKTNKGRWAARVALVVGAASGAYTSLLLPAFLWRAWRDRSREVWLQLACVAVPALLQVIFYAIVRFGLETAPARPMPPWETLAASVAVHHLGQGLLGPWLAEESAGLAGLLPAVGEAGSCSAAHLRLAGLVSLFLIGAFLVAAWRQKQARLLVVALGASSALSALLAYGVPRGRYAVVAGVLAGLLVWVVASHPSVWRRPRLAQVAMVVLIAAGAGGYWRDPVQHLVYGNFQSLRPPLESRPIWPDEVARWRADPAAGLRVWPYSESRAWMVYLRPEPSAVPLPNQIMRMHLISVGKPATRQLLRMPLQPFTFKVLSTLEAQTDGVLDVELHALGVSEEIVGTVYLGRLGHRQKRKVVVGPEDIRWKDAPVELIGFDVAANASPGGRVTFDPIRTEPLVVGLFDLLW